MFSHFYLGELTRVRSSSATSALELYDPSRAEHWIELIGNDVRTAVGDLPVASRSGCCGDVDRRRRVSDQKDAEARRSGIPSTSAGH